MFQHKVILNVVDNKKQKHGFLYAGDMRYLRTWINSRFGNNWNYSTYVKLDDNRNGTLYNRKD